MEIEIDPRGISISVLAFEARPMTDKNGRAILDADGNLQLEDWVVYAPKGQADRSRVESKIRHLYSDKDGFVQQAVVWAVIKPKYEAWKKGQELPEQGTPLDMWPGLVPAQAAALRNSGVRTVEELAEASDGILTRIPLPGIRDMKRRAAMFLTVKKDGAIEQRLSAKDAEVAELRTRLEMLQARIDAAPAAMPEPDDDDPEPPKRPRGRPRLESLRAIDGGATP